VVASLTGGQVLGAFDGEKLVGLPWRWWGYGRDLCICTRTRPGLTRVIVIAGIGRMLKLFQRDEALARGIRLVEWTFDPLELKNAHFNLNRLGAICRRLHP